MAGGGGSCLKALQVEVASLITADSVEAGTDLDAMLFQRELICMWKSLVVFIFDIIMFRSLN